MKKFLATFSLIVFALIIQNQMCFSEQTQNVCVSLHDLGPGSWESQLSSVCKKVCTEKNLIVNGPYIEDRHHQHKECEDFYDGHNGPATLRVLCRCLSCSSSGKITCDGKCCPFNHLCKAGKCYSPEELKTDCNECSAQCSGSGHLYCVKECLEKREFKAHTWGYNKNANSGIPDVCHPQ